MKQILKQRIFFLLLFCCNAITIIGIAQPNSTIDLDKLKPEKYENRILVSEKTGNKKFTAPKRFFQNTFTHYNFYFNANNKVKDIVAVAKQSFKENYTQLLPFYNYTLDNTASQTIQIDSVLYKCTAGILLHDLRNAWVDNLYLLMGKAYFLKKDFDSALYVFQYINYAWSPKDEGYDIVLGSNESTKNGIFSIATNDKAGGISRLVSKPLSRNESLLWEIRTLQQQEKISTANGIIALLSIDPNFPSRLKTELDELRAYSFYKEQVFDSAAFYLNKAISIANNTQEKARWQYLAAQLYQEAGNTKEAIIAFTKSIQYATDPLLEIYARLNIVQLSSNTKDNALQDNLKELYTLGKKEKYEDFRDIIFYAAATLELKQNNSSTAINNLKKSLVFSTGDADQKQKSMVLLADTYFKTKDFANAYKYYDSIQINTLKEIEKDRIETRKNALKTITQNMAAIHLQDSVLQLASLPEKERNILVRKLLRTLRKAEGLKESESTDFGSDNLPLNGQPTPVSNLFGTANTDFYFNNATLKQRGTAEFKSKWGNRPNVDNWRRQSVITKQPSPTAFNVSDVDDLPQNQTATATAVDQPKDLSFEGLMSNVPLTIEQKIKANAIVANALFENGMIFQNRLQEYPEAARNYKTFLLAYDTSKNAEAALFNLIFCYKKMGATYQADSINNLLKSKYPESKLANAQNQKVIVENEVTKAYNKIYNLFIEGNFEEAKKEKQQADKLLGKSYWTPQLLYIEAIAFIKQKDDSTAIATLKSLQTAFASNPLAAKATTMIDVLKRRTEIETHLLNYNEEKKEDIVQRNIDLNPTNINQTTLQPITRDTAKKATLAATTTIISKPIEPIIEKKDNYTFSPIVEHFVVLQLNRVDGVYINEIKTAFANFNRQNMYNQSLEISTQKINENYTFLLFSTFSTAGDAIDYLEKIRIQTNSKIVPWLDVKKYSFSIISSDNLTLLQSKRDVVEYNQFLKQIFPDKF